MSIGIFHWPYKTCLLFIDITCCSCFIVINMCLKFWQRWLWCKCALFCLSLSFTCGTLGDKIPVHFVGCFYGSSLSYTDLLLVSRWMLIFVELFRTLLSELLRHVTSAPSLWMFLERSSVQPLTSWPGHDPSGPWGLKVTCHYRALILLVTYLITYLLPISFLLFCDA